MTLSADEKTIHDGQPRELYDFIVAGQADLYYTNFRTDLSVLSQTYLRTDISRSEILVGHNEWTALEVYLPRSLSLCTNYVFGAPVRDIELTLRRYHGNIANVGILWKGKVTAAELVSPDTVKITVPSLLAQAVSTKVGTVVVGPLCNHWHYDSRCTVLKSSFDFATTVSSISASDPRVITIPDPGGTAQDYRGGYIQRDADGEKRLIVDQTPRTQITVIEAFRALSVGNAVTLQEGCGRTITAECKNRYTNTVNHGGFPYAPVENLFKWGVRRSGG